MERWPVVTDVGLKFHADPSFGSNLIARGTDRMIL
jgi:hypothetical protein